MTGNKTKGRQMADHGKVQNIYRIVNDAHDDLDLTRQQAIRVYQRLRAVLYPRQTTKPNATKKRKGIIYLTPLTVRSKPAVQRKRRANKIAKDK